MVVKTKEIDLRSTAYQAFEEAAGYAGMPKVARDHFEQKRTQQVAEAPEVTVAREVVVVSETP